MPNVRDTLQYQARLFQVPMSIEQYHLLPRHPDYKTEYFDGQATFSYEPRVRMARLRLPANIDHTACEIASIDFSRDREQLITLFVDAFARMAPLSSMPHDACVIAARSALRYTEQGGDGSLVPEASFVAIQDNQIVGAAIVCRTSLRRDEWPDETLPASLPNLTWLFVSGWHQRRGIATALLSHCARELSASSESWLLSHFQTGNAASMLFHWRSGFELMADPFNYRRRTIE